MISLLFLWTLQQCVYLSLSLPLLFSRPETRRSTLLFSHILIRNTVRAPARTTRSRSTNRWVEKEFHLSIPSRSVRDVMHLPGLLHDGEGWNNNVIKTVFGCRFGCLDPAIRCVVFKPVTSPPLSDPCVSCVKQGSANQREKDVTKTTSDLSEDLFKVHDFDVKIDLQVPSAGERVPVSPSRYDVLTLPLHFLSHKMETVLGYKT